MAAAATRDPIGPRTNIHVVDRNIHVAAAASTRDPTDLRNTSRWNIHVAAAASTRDPTDRNIHVVAAVGVSTSEPRRRRGPATQADAEARKYAAKIEETKGRGRGGPEMQEKRVQRAAELKRESRGPSPSPREFRPLSQSFHQAA